MCKAVHFNMSDDYTYPGYCLNNVPFSKKKFFSIYSDCIPARILNKFSTLNKADKIVKYINKNGIQVFLNDEVNIDPNRYVFSILIYFLYESHHDIT